MLFGSSELIQYGWVGLDKHDLVSDHGMTDHPYHHTIWHQPRAVSLKCETFEAWSDILNATKKNVLTKAKQLWHLSQRSKRLKQMTLCFDQSEQEICSILELEWWIMRGTWRKPTKSSSCQRNHPVQHCQRQAIAQWDSKNIILRMFLVGTNILSMLFLLYM